MAVSSKGKFIVFEGIDGAGKTTQIRLLEERLKKDHLPVCITAEPTAGHFGVLLREALSGRSKKTPCEMAALFLSDRIEHNVDPDGGIQKQIDSGRTVICDRYYYSSLAYQGSLTDMAWVADMNLHCPDIRRPDLCLFLDLTPQQSLERIRANRSNREIYETEEMLTQVRNNFYRAFDLLKDTDTICILPAFDDIDVIAEQIYRKVKETVLC